MALEVLHNIEDDCDVEISAGKYTRGSYSFKVNGLSPWGQTIRSNEEAMTALIALREAGYKVPQRVTQFIAQQIVNSMFNTGDRL